MPAAGFADRLTGNTNPRLTSLGASLRTGLGALCLAPDAERNPAMDHIEIEKRYRELQRAALVTRFDANETMFLERELTFLRQKLFEVQYPALLARSFVPKATDIPASAKTYSYKVFTQVGEASHAGYEATDHPRLDGHVKEVTGYVYPITGHFDWTLEDLREAARLGVSLSEVKARIARDAIERGIDKTLAFGAIPKDGEVPSDVKAHGLANNPDVASQGIEAGTFWFGASPQSDAILAELNAWVSEIGTESKQVFEADTVLLPKKHHDFIRQTPYSDSVSDSILTVFLKNNPQIKTVAGWHLLDKVTTGLGGADKPRGIAYKKDSAVLEGVIPQEFETLPPEVEKFKLLVMCHARCGGVKVYQPPAMRYIDFATSA